MRVAFFNNVLNTSQALYNIHDHIINKCKGMFDGEHLDMGKMVEEIGGKGMTLGTYGYDAIIFPSPGDLNSVMLSMEPFVDIPKVCFFHGWESEDSFSRNAGAIVKWAPEAVFVTADKYKKLLAKKYNSDKIHIIPFSFSTARFPKVQAPVEFTIGYLGIDSRMKQFEWVDMIKDELKVKLVGSKRVKHYGGDYEGRELEFYKAISCYVCSSWDESGPLPPIEALQCGVPVVTTNVGMMPHLKELCPQGVMLCDVNYEALKEGVRKVRVKYQEYKNAAMQFQLPCTAREYGRVISDYSRPQ